MRWVFSVDVTRGRCMSRNLSPIVIGKGREGKGREWEGTSRNLSPILIR